MTRLLRALGLGQSPGERAADGSPAGAPLERSGIVVRSGNSVAPASRPALERAISDLAQQGLLPGRGDSRGFFFLAAHPRSGTNWLSTLLNQHPEVACTGEFTFHDVFNAVQSMISQPGRAASREPMKTATIRAMIDFVAASLGTVAQIAASEWSKPGVRVVGDHTPRRLRVFMPGARYIVLVRDGRDVVVSWTYNALARREHWVVPDAIKPKFAALIERFHASGEDAASGQHRAAAELLADEVWVRHSARQWASQIRDDLDGVEKIRSGELHVQDKQVLLVRYEDLHAGARAKRDEILGFLGVDPAQAPAIEAGSRTTPGFVSEDPASHYRRGQVGDWREKLSEAAAGWIHAEAGTELAKLQYPAAG